jgi:Mn-dependent DtxR family transcriptional regulator
MARKIESKDYKKLADRVYDFYNNKHRMPSFSELTDIFGVNSKDTVSRIIENLVNLELVDKDKTGKIIPNFDKFRSQNFR